MENIGKKFATLAIHSDTIQPGWPGDPVICGISLSTNFREPVPGKAIYSRTGNPTREALQNTIAALENAQFGSLIPNIALCYASGMAAELSAIHLLKTGDEIICVDDVYGGTNRIFNKIFTSFDLTTQMVDMLDLNNLKTAISDKTKMVWLETVTNPTLKVIDIQGVKEVIQQSGKDIILVVDNTFVSPYFQQPLKLGADIVLHSVTKYINGVNDFISGHSDVLMGCLALNDQKLYDKLLYQQNAIGAVPSPFECYLTLRGIKTLALRMEQHQKNALKIASHFEKNPKINKLIYPNLESHPQHNLLRRQCSGFGGMISMELKGTFETTTKFLQALKIFTIAESLGGYESLIEHPASMTHAAVPVEERKKLKITDSFIRLSVGLEDAEDLIQDIEQALDKI